MTDDKFHAGLADAARTIVATALSLVELARNSDEPSSVSHSLLTARQLHL